MSPAQQPPVGWLRCVAAVLTALLLQVVVVPLPAAANTTPSCASGPVTATALNPPLFYLDNSASPRSDRATPATGSRPRTRAPTSGSG